MTVSRISPNRCRNTVSSVPTCSHIPSLRHSRQSNPL